MSDFLKGFRLIPPEDEAVFCIAYGSNLCEARMKARCPGAEVFGTSILHGYRMLFKHSMTGAYATIEQDANCEVPVLIYKMTAADEARLDRYEGYPKYYRKQEFLLPIRKPDGRRRRNRQFCIAYIMREHRTLGEPTADYFDLLDSGYRRWGFDPQILCKAVKDSIGNDAGEVWLNTYYKER